MVRKAEQQCSAEDLLKPNWKCMAGGCRACRAAALLAGQDLPIGWPRGVRQKWRTLWPNYEFRAHIREWLEATGAVPKLP